MRMCLSMCKLGSYFGQPKTEYAKEYKETKNNRSRGYHIGKSCA